MRIDSHQHFWHFDASRMAWIDDSMAALRADFLPEQLQPLLQQGGFDGCIAVQAAEDPAETRWLCALADRSPWIRGVVGFVDLQAADVEGQLDAIAHPRLCGIRHIVQKERDPLFLQRAEFRRGLRAVAARGLVYDLLLQPRQLRAAAELVRDLPELTFVLDHLGKPMVRAGLLRPWAQDLHALARFPNVHCKLSGLVTEADWQRWTADDLVPYVETAMQAFGPGRLLFGSDWPVCLLAAGHDRWCAAVERFLGSLPAAERASIWGGNAVRIYRLA